MRPVCSGRQPGSRSAIHEASADDGPAPELDDRLEDRQERAVGDDRPDPRLAERAHVARTDLLAEQSPGDRGALDEGGQPLCELELGAGLGADGSIADHGDSTIDGDDLSGHRARRPNARNQPWPHPDARIHERHRQ